MTITRTGVHGQNNTSCSSLILLNTSTPRKGFLTRVSYSDLNQNESFLFSWQAIRSPEAPRAAWNIPDSMCPLWPGYGREPNHHLTLATTIMVAQRAKCEFDRAELNQNCVYSTALIRVQWTVASPLTSKQKSNKTKTMSTSETQTWIIKIRIDWKCFCHFHSPWLQLFVLRRF